MNLTGRQLVELGIITGPIEQENIQQHGVDLNLMGVAKIFGPGFIPKNGKTKLAHRMPLMPCQHYVEGNMYMSWELSPGTYEITFAQGCKVPSDQRLRIVHRSSLFRNGSEINSALFDAGFETTQIGTCISVNEPIIIEVGARVGQAYVTLSNEVRSEDLYNGQFQRDQQRVSGAA